jgi:thiol-disulfide isomerase/thioredoxin
MINIDKRMKSVIIIAASLLAAVANAQTMKLTGNGASAQQSPVEDTTVSMLFNAVKSESDPQKMEWLVNRLEQKAATEGGSNTALFLNFSRGHVAAAFAEAGNVEKARYWMASLNDPAWKEGTVLEASQKLIAAGKLSAAESLLQPYLNQPRPLVVSADAFARRPDSLEFTYLYGVVLYKMEDYKKSLLYLTLPGAADKAQAVEAARSRGGAEIYALALMAAGDTGMAVRATAALLLAPGERSVAFKSAARQFFEKQYGSNRYYQQLEDAAATLEKKRLYDKVSAMRVNEPAPAFILTGTDGKKVSLESLRGKTVIIDFWATWCIPCVGSFPGMQRAVNYYAGDTSVVFMFVHTSEHGANAAEDAMRLMHNKQYTFQVYMDLKDPQTGTSPVAASFKVRGIPAKFIIDKNGMIRFKNTGFVSEEEAVPEISTMIQLMNRD